MTEETDTKHEPLPTYAALMDMRRLREEQDRRAAARRLDYSKPPPGYVIAQGGHGFLFFDQAGDRHGAAMHDLGHDWNRDTAKAKAWTHYKARNNPPGMRVIGRGGELYQWDVYPRIAGVYVEGPEFAVANPCDKDADDTAHMAARAAAWAWYDRRLVLSLRMVLGDYEAERAPLADPWPRCLTWSDAQVAEVERWLVDSTAEMPEVLRG